MSSGQPDRQSARHSSRPVRSLAEQVYERLRRNIVSGEFAPNCIVELDIAAQMEQAMLRARGAAAAGARGWRNGERTAPLSPTLTLDEMYELFSIRSLIEGFAIRHTVGASPRTMRPTRPPDRFNARRGAPRYAGADDLRHGVSSPDLQVVGQGHAAALWTRSTARSSASVVRTHRDYFGSVTAVAETHDLDRGCLRNREVEHVTPLIQQHIMLIWSLFARGDPRGANQAKERRCNKPKQPLDPAVQSVQAVGLSSVACCRREFGVFLALVGLLVLMRFLTPYFWKADNIFNVLRGMSTIGIMAIGQTMIIITGGIDFVGGFRVGCLGHAHSYHVYGSRIALGRSADRNWFWHAAWGY